MVLGDAAGFVEVASLKGIHYAMHSGILAARAVWKALEGGDVSARGLAAYDRSVEESFIKSELWSAGTCAWRSSAASTWGRDGRRDDRHQGGVPWGRIGVEPDADVPRRARAEPPVAVDGKLTFGKLDAVFRSGNKTRDDIPSHLIPASPPRWRRSTRTCAPRGSTRPRPRGRGDAPNCVACKAIDVLGPRWTPREGGRTAPPPDVKGTAPQGHLSEKIRVSSLSLRCPSGSCPRGRQHQQLHVGRQRAVHRVEVPGGARSAGAARRRGWASRR